MRKHFLIFVIYLNLIKGYVTTPTDNVGEADLSDKWIFSILTQQRDDFCARNCPSCIDKIKQIGERRYYMRNFKVNWYMAMKFCLSDGMQLASIMTPEDSEAIKKFIKGSGYEHESFWLSGTDLGSEGKFYWMANGKPVTFTNWHHLNPNNHNNIEHCLMIRNEGRGHEWHDWTCDSMDSFICEVVP